MIYFGKHTGDNTGNGMDIISTDSRVPCCLLKFMLKIFIDFSGETAYNKSEQRNLLDLSALLL